MTELSKTRDAEPQTQDSKDRPESAQSIAAQHDKQPESTYLTGVKLYLMLIGVGATVFLMMLDQTIIVTVCGCFVCDKLNY